MKKLLLLPVLFVLVMSLTACSPTPNSSELPAKDNAPKQYISPKIFAAEDVSIKIGSAGAQQETIKSGGSVSVPYGNGIIPVFVEVKETLLSIKKPMNVLIEPPSWHFDSKNRPTGSIYYFNITLDNLAPLTGKVTLSEIRGQNDEILVEQPVKFNITLVK